MTPAQQSALDALAGRTLSAEEVSQIDTELADGRLNAIAPILSTGRTRVGTVSVGNLASWAAATGMRAAIEDHAINTASPLRSIALALRDVLVGGTDGIRLDLPANAAMLAAWVSAGVLSTEHRDELLALATSADPVTDAQVQAALEAAQ